MMQRQLLKKLSFRPPNGVTQFNQRREMHSRNKKAMELIAKGWSALKEVDRVVDYCELNDHRLIPLLRAAKENFELALDADNSNTHARFWLSKLHLKYHVPGACRATGAALLIEAANMGDPDAQASDKGHAGAAIAFGSLVLRGVEIPESVTKLTSKRGSLARTARKNGESLVTDPVEMARERFQIAAKGLCELGLKWLEKLEEEEKQLLTGSEMVEQT
ncbi:PREDICTED: Sel1 [Prunus dulcis]|uniref:PREDICTED: Sel1 n=1 Tax=Prunus dulcis TaxID=3755 RepID=A0A5E4EFQ2_PRUDU|nr:PREDICTED: Sel1 [Prunus dulcis]